jgi:hypothetical protein
MDKLLGPSLRGRLSVLNGKIPNIVVKIHTTRTSAGSLTLASDLSMPPALRKEMDMTRIWRTAIFTGKPGYLVELPGLVLVMRYFLG